MRRFDAMWEFGPLSASKAARFAFGALQGALLVKRTTNDLSQINDVIAVMKLQRGAFIGLMVVDSKSRRS